MKVVDWIDGATALTTQRCVKTPSHRETACHSSSMNVYMCEDTYMHKCMHAPYMNVRMCVCMYVRMHGCTYVCVHAT